MRDSERNAKLREIKKSNAKTYRAFERAKKRRVPASAFTTRMNDDQNVLEIDDLHTWFYTDVGTVRAVDGVTISVPRGTTVGIVGESGCGKSVTSLSVLRLLQEPQGQITSGAIRFASETFHGTVDLARMSARDMDTIRGNEIAMIFQEPMTTLNPVFSIGRQLDEVLLYHNPERLSKRAIAERSRAMLKTVGIANAEGVYRMYPHELSGGMRQRVVIAMALACNPRLIIADEPTTALDVTIQAQILDLLKSLKDQISASIMLITHDLGVIAETADYVVVMYAGRVVEQGTVRDIFHAPSHPYTVGLMRSRPSLSGTDDKLYAIPGNVPNPIELPDYCFFRNRCEQSVRACEGGYPPMFAIGEQGPSGKAHQAACWRALGQANTQAVGGNEGEG